MAIAQGDEVALTRSVSQTLASNGKVLFGIVIAVSAPNASVVWDNGQSESSIPTAQLDKIVGSNSAAGIAQINDSGSPGAFPSPEYRAIVQRRYSRQNNGAGALSTYYLLKTLATGVDFEAPDSAVSFIDGQ